MSYHVLIVDDSPVMRRVVARSLSMSGLPVEEVVQAGNGKDALAILRSQPIDLMLADINMPEMSGIDLVEEMVAHPSAWSTQIVMISTDRNQDRIARLKALGVRAYLTKPFRPEDLFTAVQSLIPEASAP